MYPFEQICLKLNSRSHKWLALNFVGALPTLPVLASVLEDSDRMLKSNYKENGDVKVSVTS